MVNSGEWVNNNQSPMQACVNILGVRTSEDETENRGPSTGLLHLMWRSQQTAKGALMCAMVSGKGVPSHFSINSLGAKTLWKS